MGAQLQKWGRANGSSGAALARAQAQARPAARPHTAVISAPTGPDCGQPAHVGVHSVAPPTWLTMGLGSASSAPAFTRLTSRPTLPQYRPLQAGAGDTRRGGSSAGLPTAACRGGEQAGAGWKHAPSPHSWHPCPALHSPCHPGQRGGPPQPSAGSALDLRPLRERGAQGRGAAEPAHTYVWWAALVLSLCSVPAERLACSVQGTQTGAKHGSARNAAAAPCRHTALHCAGRQAALTTGSSRCSPGRARHGGATRCPSGAAQTQRKARTARRL